MDDFFSQFLSQYEGKVFIDNPSPLGRWLAGVVRSAGPGTVTLDYTVRNEMTNPAGVLHGGVISAILDEVIGMTLYMNTTAYHASVNLTVDFLSPAREGDVIRCTSRLVRQGGKIVNAEGTLTAADGRLIARATTNLIRLG